MLNLCSCHDLLFTFVEVRLFARTASRVMASTALQSEVVVQFVSKTKNWKDSNLLSQKFGKLGKLAGKQTLWRSLIAWRLFPDLTTLSTSGQAAVEVPVACGPFFGRSIPSWESVNALFLHRRHRTFASARRPNRIGMLFHCRDTAQLPLCSLQRTPTR